MERNRQAARGRLFALAKSALGFRHRYSPGIQCKTNANCGSVWMEGQEEIGELGQGELLGAGGGWDGGGAEGLGESFVGECPEIVAKRFALLGETGLDEGKESICIGNAQNQVFAGEGHLDHGGIDTWRRSESAGRNAQNDLRLRIEPAENGEIAVIARARLSDDSFSNFFLDDHIDG